MSELEHARRGLEQAEAAAVAGDFSAAYDLLQESARLQETALGPLHPDLANTLNNLAIVAEKLERIDEAEASYRRAAFIAAASLPADHAMVVESRQNLEDFCRARGLPVQVPIAAGHQPPSLTPQESPTVPAPSSVRTEAAPSVPLAPRRQLPRTFIVAAVVILILVGVVVWRPWARRETPASMPMPTSVPPSATSGTSAPAPPPLEPLEPAPRLEPTPPPSSLPRAAQELDAPAVRPARSSTISLLSAQVCVSFSTAESEWRCDPASDLVPAGPLVFYTRVRSSQDAAIVHHWYRGETPRQTVRLAVRANANEGYRTYSRHSVNSGAWRVEARTVDGELLQEQRFTVR